MPYNLKVAIVLRPGLAGLGATLRGRLLTAAGADYGSEISTGFVEIGSGHYIWTIPDIPDDHDGAAKVYVSGSPTVVLCVVPIIPSVVLNDPDNTGIASAVSNAADAKTAAEAVQAKLPAGDAAMHAAGAAVASVTGSVGSVTAAVTTDSASREASKADISGLVTHLTDIKGSTFNTSTDSLEAIRDRGDAAWISGGASLDASEIRAAIGLATANLDTQLSGLSTDIDTTKTTAQSIEAITDQITFDSGRLQAISTLETNAIGSTKFDTTGLTAVGQAVKTAMEDTGTKLTAVHAKTQQIVIESGKVIASAAVELQEEDVLLLATTIAAALEAGAAGTVVIDHNYGGEDKFRYVTSAGIGIMDGTIKAYLAADYNAGNFVVRGMSTTGADGRWLKPIFLFPNAYKLVFYKVGVYKSSIVDLVVAEP